MDEEIASTLTTSATKFRPEQTYVVMSSGQANAAIVEGQVPTLTANLNEQPIVASWPATVASTLNRAFGEKQGLEDQHINSGAPLFVLYEQQSLKDENWAEKQVKNNLAASSSKSQHAVVGPRSIRRLTPRECERLQGFPDDYTKIKGAKDGPRYEALGNSMTTHVMAWIGRRIDLVDKLLKR